jgi:hypothetical protein
VMIQLPQIIFPPKLFALTCLTGLETEKAYNLKEDTEAYESY